MVGDSNRRREFLPESTQQNLGRTLGASDPVPTGAAVINPFPTAGTDAQTVSALQGARYLRAPTQPGELQFPEAAPIAAFDGNLSTAWVANRNLPVFDRWIEIGFDAPRDVPYVDLYPLSDSHGVVTEVDVNGIHHALGLGWTRIPVHLRSVQRTADHDRSPRATEGRTRPEPAASERSASPASTSANCSALRSCSVATSPALTFGTTT